MKLASITFKPIAWVSFSDSEIDLLMKCSALHYDGVCKDVGRKRGFLYGMFNFKDTKLHCLTFKELDTLAKISEMPPSFGGEEAIQTRNINFELMKLLRTLNEETPKEKVMA